MLEAIIVPTFKFKLNPLEKCLRGCVKTSFTVRFTAESPDYIGLRLTDFGFSCTIFGVAYPKPQKFRDRELRSE